MTAPAARSRATRVASRSGRVWANGGPPAVVGMPATSMMSLIPTGTPWSGPGSRPLARSSSRARASARAASASTVVHAPIAPSVAAIRARHASRSSPAVVRPARMAATASATPRSVRSVELVIAVIVPDRSAAACARGPITWSEVSRYFAAIPLLSRRNAQYSRPMAMNGTMRTTSLRVGQAAEMLQVSVETLRRWETEGRLRMERSSGGQRIVPIGEVTRLLAERRSQAPGPADRRPARPATASPGSSPGSRRTASPPSSR